MDDLVLAGILSMFNIDPYATEHLLQLDCFLESKIEEQEEILKDDFLIQKQWYINFGKREAYIEVQKYLVKIQGANKY